MSKSQLLKSSIGQKAIMAITGIFLISFLLVHAGINALIFYNDGGIAFNEGAEFMGHNPIIRTMEIVLFAGFIAHIAQALVLTLKNRKARPVAYAVKADSKNSKWYTRSMGLLGTLILIFLILHMKHFWYVSRLTDEITSGRETLFDEMKEVFAHLWIVILYMAAMVSLAYHLLHGFQSAFQTLGLNHKSYFPAVKITGVLFSIVIPFVFAVMPLSMYLGWIK
jgi:succinate dehydrogenase / fumarate reductase, cytochrome b subunit